VLIVLGLLFLLGNLGMLPWGNLAHWFAHYWPVLLILWGVIKIVEHQQAQRAGVRASGIGVGGVFLVLFLIMLGLAATQASRLDWDSLRDHIQMGDGDFEIFGHNYSYEDQLQQAFADGSSLHVVDDHGAVNVTASEDGQIRVSVRKRVNADTQSGADKRNGETKPQISVSGNIVTVNANTQVGGDHGVTADLDISIPRKAAVVISNRRGDVSVVGRNGDIDISNQHGEVSASDINGKLSLTLQNSSIRVGQISSDVLVQGHADDVSIEDVKGVVHLDGEFSESVKLSRIGKGVVFRSSRTDMELAGLSGDLDLDSGDLRANDMMGPLRLSTRSKDISLEGVTGDVRIENENGSVELHLNKLGTTEVQNRNGDVQIYVPDKSGFVLDARARNGEIETDFDALKINNDNDTGIGTGTVGSGGPHITLNNEHGGIEIRKNSSASEPPAMPAMPKMPKGPKAGESPTPTEN
jgi:DUF4097 and DUF4098 domain-containing protein YvlB